MQRRTLLGLAGSVGIVGSLGVMVKLSNPPAGRPVTFAEEPLHSTSDWNRPVVATDTTTVGSEKYGIVRQQASVLDLEPTGRYALISRCRLIPGSNYDASSGWKTASLTVEHAWRSGSLVSHSGNVVPTEEDEADSNLYLRTSHSTGRYHWRLRFKVPTGNSHTVLSPPPSSVTSRQ